MNTTVRRLAIGVVSTILCWAAPASAIEFQDVTTSSLQGRAVSAESWGIAFGDINGDDWPDMVMGNHRNRASIYLNQGNGVLSNVVTTAGRDIPLLLNRFQDEHMFGLGDVDGDGDDDLGENRSHDIWLSNNGIFQNTGSVSQENMAYRSTVCPNDDFYPLGFDEDQDFGLDFACHRPATAFTRVSPTIAHLMDLRSDDFDGDGLLDVVAVRGSYFMQDAARVNATRIEAQFAPFEGQNSFTFTATPPLVISVWPRRALRDNATLNGSGTVGGIDFTLAGGVWTVTGAQAHIMITAASGVSAPSPLSNPRNTDAPLLPTLLRATGNGNWQNATSASGFNTQVRCAAVTTGDFDNDMDVDVYFGCRGGGVNIPNILYENNGNGVFSQVANAGGAAGVVGGARGDGAGTTAEVVSGDYNNDGFLDLAVTNGHNDVALRQGGPHQLFRNVGNGNNWIQLKLRGTAPAYDALGAKVTAVAGGVTQVRLQDGGNHRSSHNLQRVHFGLASNSSADITVVWPNGQTETFNNLGANQIYDVNQNGSATPITLSAVAELSPPSGNDDCGQSTIFSSLDQAMFLYQTSCGSNNWSVRVSPGGVSNVQFVGKLVATNGGTIGAVNGISIEGNDQLTSSASEVSFTLNTAGAGVDGFNFQLTGDACLYLDAPSNIPVLVGPGHHRLFDRGINPRTLQPCSPPQSITLSLQDVSGNEGDGTINGLLTLSAPSSSPVSATVFTQAGTATGGSDYFGFTSNVTVPAGQTQAQIPVGIVDDQTVEGDETFRLRMVNPVGGTIADNIGVVTIVDNDTGGSAALSVADITVNEGTGQALVTVSLSQPVNASVVLFTRAGTATGGSDYFGFTTAVNFTGGQTTRQVTITLVNDTVAESQETFEVRLTNPSGATIATPSAVITIDDDD